MAAATVFPAFLKMEIAGGSKSVFPALVSEAASAADQVSRHFRTSMDAVKQSIASATSQPLNSAGAMDLGTGKFREAAQAAETRAAALRRVAAAADQLATEERSLSGAQQVYIQDTKRASQAADEEARTLRERANFYDKLQLRMNAATGGTAAAIAGTNRLSQAHEAAAGSSARMRAASQQLSYQIGDVSQQLALGVNPAVVFGQQFGQIIQALQLMSQAGPEAARAADTVTTATSANTGATSSNTRAHRSNAVATAESALAAGVDAEAQAVDAAAANANTGATNRLTAAKARLLAFLGTGWGAIITGGITVLGLMASKYLHLGSAVDNATDKLKEQAKADEVSSTAKERFIRTEEGVRKAILDATEARKKGIESSRTEAEQANISAKANLEREIGIRKTTLAQIEQARIAQRILGGPGISSERGIGVAQRAARELAEGLGKEAAAQQILIDKAKAEVLASRADLADEAARRAVDPVERIKRMYEGPDGLIEQAKRRATAEGQVTSELTKQITALRRRMDIEVKAAQDSQRATRSSAQTIAFRNPVDGTITSGFGARRAPKAGASTFHQGIDFGVPTGTAVRAPAVGTVEAVGFDPKLGKYVVIDHGAGTKTKFGHLSDTSAVHVGTQLAAGDVFARSGNTGNSTGAHLHYSVIQGGKYVDPRKGRFKVSAGDAALDTESDIKRAADEAARALAELERELDATISAFDPARAAAAEYADQLDRIARLEAAGKLNPAEAAQYRHTAAIASLLAEERAAEEARAEVAKNLSEGLRQATDKPLIELEMPSEQQFRDAGILIGESFNDSAIETARTFAAVIGGKMGSVFGDILGIMGGLQSGNYGGVGGKFGALLNLLSGGSDPTSAQGKSFAKAVAPLKDTLESGLGKLGTSVQGLSNAVPYLAASMAINQGLNNLLGIKDRTGGLLGPGGALLLNEIIPSKRASSTITFSGGALGATGAGNSSKYRAASGEAADSAMANIMRIAEALGATITGTGSVSIGVRDGKYRVDTSGKGITKTKKGALDFGEDAAAAVKAATLDLIKDGMLAGMKAGSLRLLQSAKDLEIGLSKALKFEGVFQELKRRTDPVGAALDGVNRRFEDLKNVFIQAGAAAEEMADLEKLYALERTEAIETAGRAMTGTLQSLLDDLRGNNDAFSLRDRLDMARAKYDPLAAEIAAGNYAHADAFADAARAVEEIVRQIEGSQKGYFDFIDQAAGLTKGALDAQAALVATASGSGSPFGPAEGPKEQPVVGAIDRLGNYLVDQLGGRLDGHLSAVNDNLGTLIRSITGGGGGSGGLDMPRMERLGF